MPISSSLAFPFKVNPVTGVALSFAALFSLTIIPAKSDNGADAVALLPLLLLMTAAAAEDKASDAPHRECA